MTPVAMVTNIWKFGYKVNVIGLYGSPHSPTHDHKTANINVKKTKQFKTRCKDDMVNPDN